MVKVSVTSESRSPAKQLQSSRMGLRKDLIDASKVKTPTCKFCKSLLVERFVDIVLPESENLSKGKGSNSLATYVCSECFLVQEENLNAPSYPEQVYVSTFSSSWLNDMRLYINRVFKRFEMTDHHLLAELAWRETLLPEQSFLPFGNKGLPALIDMHGKADTLICKDALANVTDLHDFVSAIKVFLKPTGITTLEFLHLLPLMESSQFEVQFTEGRVPYFSFTTLDKIFKHHGLTIFNTEECLPKGCIRVYAKHQENALNRVTCNIQSLRGRERDKGMSSLDYYINFRTKHALQTQPIENESLLKRDAPSHT